MAFFFVRISGSWLNMAESMQRILQSAALDGQHPKPAADHGAVKRWLKCASASRRHLSGAASRPHDDNDQRQQPWHRQAVQGTVLLFDAPAIFHCTNGDAHAK